MIATARISTDDNYTKNCQPGRSRTRADPFEKVQKEIRRQLQANPNLQAKVLFIALQRQHPGKFLDGQLRTLQRRLKSWRETESLVGKARVPRRSDQTSICGDVQLENPRQRAFLSAFERTCCIRWAARAACVSRESHYRWLRDPTYAAVFEQTRRSVADYLEAMAVERASEGWLEPVFYQGSQCGEVRKYSDGLMHLLLRGMMPEKYGAFGRGRAQA